MVCSDVLALLLKLQVDQWLDFAPQLVAGASFAAACEAANAALTLRTYLAGHSMSVADVAVWGQLKGVLLCSSVGHVPRGTLACKKSHTVPLPSGSAALPSGTARDTQTVQERK
jgi:hypothetical protein